MGGLLLRGALGIVGPAALPYTASMARLNVHLIPALSDNYIPLVADPESAAVAVVDPAESGPVIETCARLGLVPTMILNTHHHPDHVGGNLALKDRYGLTIVGPAAEAPRIPGLDRAVGEGDTVSFGSLAAQVLDVRGHTAGHIAYWLPEAATVFVGDTLFAAGCGRLFEGTPAEMWRSLSKLMALPPDTRVYCAHEYTQANIRFALSVDGANAALRDRAAAVAATRAQGLPTVPTTIGMELATNPFLRARDADFAAALGLAGRPPVDVFAAARAAKDSFRG